MIHTYLFIYSFNIAVAVAVSRSEPCRRNTPPALLLLLLLLLLPRGAPPDCPTVSCRSLLSLALGIRSIRVKTEFRDRKFFIIDISCRRPAGRLEPPLYLRIAPHPRSPIRSCVARVNPPLGERESKTVLSFIQCRCCRSTALELCPAVKGGKVKERRSRVRIEPVFTPVGRIHRLLRKGNYAERVGAVLPSTWPPLWNISPPRCSSWPVTRRATTRRPGSSLDIQLAIRNDEELNKLLSGVTIAQGGVLPNIQAVLLPKKTEKKANGARARGAREKIDETPPPPARL
ncbi:Histone H2A [Eumeta japonica]|uniref:Histone H2A n=1 Tax=Eumeta variegata TaxID=151549 RepID=A0A4C1ZSM5_EUMVA|nr:Histone H2A [Eumeta japonica]